MKPNPNDYEVRIWYSPDPGDECFVAQVLALPGIMAHGESREAAAHEIQTALQPALDTYAAGGESPPAPKNHAAVIQIDDQWRICFRWAGTDAERVEIIDYH